MKQLPGSINLHPWTSKEYLGRAVGYRLSQSRGIYVPPATIIGILFGEVPGESVWQHIRDILTKWDLNSHSEEIVRVNKFSPGDLE